MESDIVKITYEFFRLAMRNCIVNKDKTGLSVKKIAYELGVKPSRISTMHKEGTKKPANFQQQILIANLAGMSYEDFLEFGKDLYGSKHGRQTVTPYIPVPAPIEDPRLIDSLMGQIRGFEKRMDEQKARIDDLANAIKSLSKAVTNLHDHCNEVNRVLLEVAGTGDVSVLGMLRGKG